MLDALFEDLSQVCSQLLPILGAVALIFLCVGLKKFWKVIESINTLLKKLDPTVDLTNESLTKVQAPLDTVVNLSHGVDDASVKLKENFDTFKQNAAENVSKLKDYVNDKVNPAPVVVPAEEPSTQEKEEPKEA